MIQRTLNRKMRFIMSSKTLDRRQFVKSGSRFVAGGILTASSAPAVLGKAQDRPPNVLFVICDQMRGDALGCLGHPNARTPHLDRLAAGGTLFENAYCNNSVCIPSRMSMFSGKYPHQTGRLSNTAKGDGSFLDIGDTLAGHFMDRGFRTGWIGKNHTYRKSAFNAFDRASIRAREPFRKYSRFIPPHWHSDVYWPEELCHPRRNTDEAVQFIEESKPDEPFFLHVSYFDPHPPYMAPAEYTRRYHSKDMKPPPYVPASALSERLAQFARMMKSHQMTEADLTETLRYYYAAIEWGVDAQIGRLMNALERAGIADNTIVVFTSDHGDFMGEHRMVRKGIFLYDALLHVPMIWSAPGRIAGGLRIKNLAQCVDLFPTLIDLTGGKERDDLMGRSLKPFLQGESKREEDFAIYASGAYGDVASDIVDPSITLDDKDETPLHTRVMRQCMQPDHRTSMLRTMEWKLILNETAPPELYRMNGTWIERENLAGKKPYVKVQKTLEERLGREWAW